jgi:hypothetical protein
MQPKLCDTENRDDGSLWSLAIDLGFILSQDTVVRVNDEWEAVYV